jgi:hypothetical protein
METKTTAMVGIIFLVLVIGGALALSTFGVSTVGQYYKKSTFTEGTCETAHLYQNGVCLPKETGEQTYLDDNGCCRACTDMAYSANACGDCLGLSENCRWQTADEIIACFDTTDALFFDNCVDYCETSSVAKGENCYHSSCSDPMICD